MLGYFLDGSNGESLLVFRTADRDRLLAIIKKVGGMRDKDIKALAERLEREWYGEF